MSDVNVQISTEAQMLLEELHIGVPDFLEWFVKNRKIWAGGGDVIAYLKHRRLK